MLLSTALEATPPHPTEVWKALAPACVAALYNTLTLLAEERIDKNKEYNFNSKFL